MQFILVTVVELTHVLLLMLLALLGVLLSVLGLILAPLLVALELDDCALADDLHHGAVVEDVEYFEFLIEVGEEFGHQQDDHFLVLNQVVDEGLPIFVLIVVQKHGLDLAEVAALLLLALDELVFEGLDVRLHLVALQDAAVVDSPLGVELADLGVEELAVVLQGQHLVVGAQIGGIECEVVLDAHHVLTYCEILDEGAVVFGCVDMSDEIVNQIDLMVELVACEVVLQTLKLSVSVDILREVVDVANLHRFDLELVVFTFTYYDALARVFYLLILVVLEVILETHLHVSNYILVIVHLVVNLTPFFLQFVLPDN